MLGTDAAAGLTGAALRRTLRLKCVLLLTCSILARSRMKSVFRLWKGTCKPLLAWFAHPASSWRQMSGGKGAHLLSFSAVEFGPSTQHSQMVSTACIASISCGPWGPPAAASYSSCPQAALLVLRVHVSYRTPPVN